MIKHQLLVAVFASLTLAGWSQSKDIIVESYSDGQNSQGFSSVTGKWTESAGKSTAQGLTGTKAVFNEADVEPAVGRFTPEIPVAGKYEVFITYPAQGNASDIKYTVVSADGSKDIKLTQNGRDLSNAPAANQWYSLGAFNFNAGKAGYVEVTDPLTGAHPLPNEPNARIYADAVKFVPAGGAAATSVVVASPPATVVAGAAPSGDLPTLPPPAAVQVAAATPANMPGLPAVQAAGSAPAEPSMPSLPATTPIAGVAAEMPALPGATPASATIALPSLPSTTPAAVPGLPALPSMSPAAPSAALPDLPPAVNPSTPVVTPMAMPETTPYPVPNLPSLAPVTPTPERNLPSPSDTPMAGPVTGLPGGPLSTMPPTQLPAVVQPGPASLPSTLPAMPGQQASIQPPTGQAAPAGFGLDSSITQYNPSNLQWMYDYGAGLNAARSQNKKVLVFFTAAGNKAGTTYETTYFNDPSVRQALDKYVLVKVDFPKNTRLGYTLGIFGAGIIVVVNPDGEVTARITQLPATPVDLVNQMAAAKLVVPAPTPASAAVATPPAGTGLTTEPAGMAPVGIAPVGAVPPAMAPVGMTPVGMAPVGMTPVVVVPTPL